ncbi:uncharacterized protein LOC135090605 [Scylla paramamosain]|uniref:uncharacterized protein LOC135090605 n=1 Tax=Scylla paramamosain TaxID=85552 RepID=UPI003082F765
MIMGPRPTLGWLGYLLLNGSWYRLTVLLGLLGILSMGLVHRSRHSVTLQHLVPPPFPPPIMFLPAPSHGYMSALDACSVEAAGEWEEHMGARKDWPALNVVSGKRRQVHVYLWSSSLSPHDVWGQWVEQLPRVTVSLLDVPRTVTRTPIKGLAKLIGWTTYPEWMVWMAARVALLWGAGGMLLPLGVVATRPLWLEASDHQALLTVVGRHGLVDPVVMCAAPSHPVLAAAARMLDGSEETVRLNNAEELLTVAVKTGCGVEGLKALPSGNCSTVRLLPATAVLDMAPSDTTPSQDVREAGAAALLRATGDPSHLHHLPTVHHLFLSYRLARYCPKTAQLLEAMYRQSL